MRLQLPRQIVDAGLDAIDAAGDIVHESEGADHFGLGVAGGGGHGGAHEGALLDLGAEHNVGEDGFIELDEFAASVAEGDKFLAEDVDEVSGEADHGGVGGVGDALDPHGAGEQVGAGEGDLDGTVGVFLEEEVFVEGEGARGG